MSEKLALSPEEVAEVTGLSESTVYRCLVSGDLPGSKVGNRWVTLREELIERIRDDRVPKPRRSEDPMPRRRKRSTFSEKVVDLESRRVA